MAAKKKKLNGKIKHSEKVDYEVCSCWWNCI